MNIQEMVSQLEKGMRLPGTQICRVMLDNKLCEKEGIPTDSAHEASIIWCVGVGRIQEPKGFFYGLTIEVALRKALEG
jgi:hypothetical protein